MKSVFSADAAHFQHFDMKHWFRVKEARIAANLSKEHVSRDVPHNLLGKTLTDTQTGTVYTVERVFKDWWRGWFLAALLRDANNSHRLCYIKNTSCIDEGILKQIALFQESFGQSSV